MTISALGHIPLASASNDGNPRGWAFNAHELPFNADELIVVKRAKWCRELGVRRSPSDWLWLKVDPHSRREPGSPTGLEAISSMSGLGRRGLLSLPLV